MAIDLIYLFFPFLIFNTNWSQTDKNYFWKEVVFWWYSNYRENWQLNKYESHFKDKNEEEVYKEERKDFEEYFPR